MYNVKILDEKFLDLIFVKFGEAGPVKLNVQIILGSIKVANSLSISIHHYVLFVLCLYVVLVLSHFGFEDRILVLVVPVPSHHLVSMCKQCKY